MKWTTQHDVLLGRKYKNSSREQGQRPDRVAEKLNQIKVIYFNVNQKYVRDRLKVLESAFKTKDQSERNASGIFPEETEIDTIMEDYLERKLNRKLSMRRYVKKVVKKLKRTKHLLKQCVIWLCNLFPKQKGVVKIVQRRKEGRMGMTRCIF